eukprot:s129_g7.t1
MLYILAVFLASSSFSACAKSISSTTTSPEVASKTSADAASVLADPAKVMLKAALRGKVRKAEGRNSLEKPKSGDQSGPSAIVYVLLFFIPVALGSWWCASARHHRDRQMLTDEESLELQEALTRLDQLESQLEEFRRSQAKEQLAPRREYGSGAGLDMHKYPWPEIF